ncbi:unnamed protein product [Didymodactylos carnosus]|uniref:C2 domain-containing protein n=1 Tax=Didymodactylos carnosus TaxID=1234261 RepID=A0A814HI58_9BILA|nr:unnamed protein product [Didymodactylos carnosus]CAF3782486.1 unnamed protein product [Didymodactylos carnosus]
MDEKKSKKESNAENDEVEQESSNAYESTEKPTAMNEQLQYKKNSSDRKEHDAHEKKEFTDNKYYSFCDFASEKSDSCQVQDSRTTLEEDPLLVRQAAKDFSTELHELEKKIEQISENGEEKLVQSFYQQPVDDDHKKDTRSESEQNSNSELPTKMTDTDKDHSLREIIEINHHPVMNNNHQNDSKLNLHSSVTTNNSTKPVLAEDDLSSRITDELEKFEHDPIVHESRSRKSSLTTDPELFSKLTHELEEFEHDPAVHEIIVHHQTSLTPIFESNRRIELFYMYDDERSKFLVNVLKLEDAIDPNKNHLSDLDISVNLLPNENNHIDQTIKVEKLNSQKNHAFEVVITYENLRKKILSLNIKHKSETQFVGQVNLSLSDLKSGEKRTQWFSLQPEVVLMPEIDSINRRFRPFFTY